MRLTDFPTAIATTHRQLLAQDQLIRRMQEDVNQLTAAIEHDIAFDPNLKNDAQRKAERLSRMGSDPYLGAADELQTQIDKRTDMLIHLNYLRDQFTVEKLLFRDRVSQQEAIAA